MKLEVYYSVRKGMAKIFHRNFSEIFNRAILLKSYAETSVRKSVLDKLAGKGFRPAIRLKRSFHLRGFPSNTS